MDEGEHQQKDTRAETEKRTTSGIATAGTIAVRVLALLLLAVLMFREQAGFQKTEDCSGREIPSNELSSPDYLLITSLSSFKDPNDQLVRLVTLSPGEEPDEVLHNLCAQRAFMAKLVRKLKHSAASVIVLDKRYSQSGCLSQPKATQDLVDAVAERGSQVVVGLGSGLVPPPEQKILGGRRTCFTVTPHVNFVGVSYGLLRLDPDTRRVPLEWPAFGNSTADPKLMPSLALVAAEQANPNLRARKRLLRILQSGKQPFSRFSPRNTFNKYSALKLLCGTAATLNTAWSTCPEDPDAGSKELQGKIVVIGDYSDCDRHESVLGQMYGVDLQGNYIAALLSDDVYVPIGDTFSNAIYVTVWFILVQAVFVSVRPPWRAAAFCCGAWVLIFAGSLILLTYFGYLFTFWFQGLNFGIILLTWVEYWLHGMARHGSETHSPTSS